MNRTTQNLSHAERVRARRLQQTTRRVSLTKKTVYRPETVFQPVAPRPHKQTRTPQGKKPKPGMKKSRQRYDIAFTMGRTDVRAPGIVLPQPGPRLVSAILCTVLLFSLYALLSTSTFKVEAAEVSGNERLGTNEISNALGIVGKPIFFAAPAQVAASLLKGYPDLASAEVHVAFPNRIIVNVAERTPVLGWYQDGVVVWIDKDGLVIPSRGESLKLLKVLAESNAKPLQLDFRQAMDQKVPFMTSAMVQAFINLSSSAPAGGALRYNTTYGMGWDDVQGWQVFFGQEPGDLPAKLTVYQAIVTTLVSQGIHPTLISVADPEHPVYR
jgi:hypothetical protein